MTLSGHSISELRKLGDSDRISASDMLFVSQQIIPGDLTENYGYFSESISYGKFVDLLFADLSSSFGFGGLAREDDTGYSPARHSHPYNAFSVSSTVNASTAVLATFVVDGRKTRIAAPAPFVYKEPDPAIGELKFLAVPEIKRSDRINVNSKDFDGWVYPAGQTYYVQSWQFQEAKALFGLDRYSNQLNIPSLSGFIKASCQSQSGFEPHAGTSGVPYHGHSNASLYFKGQAKQGIDLTVGVTSQDFSLDVDNVQPRNALDIGQEQDYQGTIALTVTHGSVTGNVQQSSSRYDVESYPSHNMLPVMIYIGKNTDGKEDEEKEYDSSDYTHIYMTDGQIRTVNVVDLTKEALELAGK